MDLETSGDLVICGNFAKLEDSKPKDFDYMRTAKWLEDYPFDKRECIGGTICSCKKVEVHYAPYHGWSHFHTNGCNLMRKVKARPQLMILWAYEHLPGIAFSKQAVPADTHIPLFVETTSRTQHVKVRVRNVNGAQGVLL